MGTVFTAAFFGQQLKSPLWHEFCVYFFVEGFSKCSMDLINSTTNAKWIRMLNYTSDRAKAAKSCNTKIKCIFILYQLFQHFHWINNGHLCFAENKWISHNNNNALFCVNHWHVELVIRLSINERHSSKQFHFNFHTINGAANGIE